jgi:hypothetical protein
VTVKLKICFSAVPAYVAAAHKNELAEFSRPLRDFGGNSRPIL